MISGKDIIEQAGILLQDDTYTRWTLPELCLWLNAGVKAIVLAKPSAHSTSRVLNLQLGTLQTIDPIEDAPTPLLLLSINRNIITAGNPTVGGRPIKLTGRPMLDAMTPDWHDPVKGRFNKTVKHYTYDENVPLEFYVYPGNTGDGMVEAVIASTPAPLVADGPPNVLDNYAGIVGLPEPYSGPLLDYVLYRAFSKDDLVGNPARSQGHYAAFATAIGLKVQVERATSPNATRGAV